LRDAARPGRYNPAVESVPDIHPYSRLSPDTILAAIETTGLRCDGRLLALNSYENRVYQVGIEDAQPVIVKFYRPERWSREAILEEHAFALELAEREIPVVPPHRDEHGNTLHLHDGFLFAVYPRCGGRWPDLDTRDQRLQMGRFLGRMHAVGSAARFEHREILSIDNLGRSARSYLIEHDWIPAYLHEAYSTLSDELLDRARDAFDAAGPLPRIRLHGDCHPGNILWTDSGPHFVDLDDSRTGPAIQDIWMLLSGDAADMRTQLEDLLEGYRTFCDFEPAGILLIEALRTLRIMNYAAWVARRWDDPAFPRAFPWFDSPRYWEEHILALREQAAAMSQAPLV
jgi:Ser/Thr protein kinase RdoA (MazF antagonist)